MAPDRAFDHAPMIGVDEAVRARHARPWSTRSSGNRTTRRARPSESGSFGCKIPAAFTTRRMSSRSGYVQEREPSISRQSVEEPRRGASCAVDDRVPNVLEESPLGALLRRASFHCDATWWWPQSQCHCRNAQHSTSEAAVSDRSATGARMNVSLFFFEEVLARRPDAK